jgi:predicted nucleotidyltransferase component of viral defense system
MRISRERLAAEAAATGFRPEVLEKVIHLLSLLEGIRSHPYLGGRVALKGGTALNLFIFDVPRLSVDIDLNYIGASELETMQAERPLVEDALQAVLAREGHTVVRMPPDHAGGKWRLRYPSATGQQANLEVDLNFMFRVPLWPSRRLDSRAVGSYSARGIPVLDVHELAAGKLAALFARTSGRDLFDVHRLLLEVELDPQRLRLAFVVYGAMNRRDWRATSVESIAFDRGALEGQLLPMLRREGATGGLTPAAWGERLVSETHDALGRLLPFSEAEAEFLVRILDDGEIVPELITADTELADRIRRHPLLQWKALNVRQHKSP